MEEVSAQGGESVATVESTVAAKPLLVPVVVTDDMSSLVGGDSSIDELQGGIAVVESNDRDVDV